MFVGQGERLALGFNPSQKIDMFKFFVEVSMFWAPNLRPILISPPFSYRLYFQLLSCDC